MAQFTDKLNIGALPDQKANNLRILLLRIIKANQQFVRHDSGFAHERQLSDGTRQFVVGAAQVKNHLTPKDRGAQVGRRVQSQQARLENRHAVTETVGFVQVMGTEKDRSALLAQVSDEIAHQVRGFRVKAGGWLVQEEHAGFVEQGARDGKFLPHAFREGTGGVGASFPKPQHPQILLHLPADIFYLVEFCKDPQVVLC